MGVVSCGTTMLDQGVFENIGAVTWDTTVKTSGFTAVSGNGYFCNTTSAAFTVTLPSSPSAGDIVGIKDYANTADTNNITIGRNGSNIQGSAADFKITTEGGSVLLVYIDGTKGWLVTSASQASDISNPQFVTATGGTITTSGDFKIHTFTGPGTFCVSNGGNPSGSDSVNYIVVAGGGGGGGAPASPDHVSGGGGAGGLRTSFCTPASALPVTATGFPITVGGGGTGGPGGSRGTNGSNSTAILGGTTITSCGGGTGGAGPPGPSSGSTGGSGGGGASAGGGPGSCNEGVGICGQGNPGGRGFDAAPGDLTGGGGGGASAAGAAGNPPSSGGPGGAGTDLSPFVGNIGPTSSVFAGGGGGAKRSGTQGTGGAGGGGAANSGSNGVAGTTNTGGGGGGTAAPGANTGGAGGSGIVIIKYKFQ